MLRAILTLTAVLGFTTVAEALEGKLIDKLSKKPIAGATISIVGATGSATSDDQGNFSIKPDPRLPFTMIIVLEGGRVAKPVFVERIEGPLLTVSVEAAVTEEVTVTSGVAPSIDAPPGSALTLLSSRDIALRSPANLMSTVETVPGVSQVSEGQAAVPAVRGMARGRTLILVDGSRVTSERRVGPSATFMDPALVDGVDVARGPGSVAYGSDAFGGVISVRTKRPPREGLTFGGSATIGAGVPEQRGDFTIGKGFGTGGVIVTVHGRNAEDYDSPEGEVLNSGWADSGVLARAERRTGGGQFSVSYEGDFGRDIERPRNNSNQVRFYSPFENSHRINAGYDLGSTGAFDHVSFSGFFGTIEQRTDQDRIPTSTRPRDIVRADISANDFQVRASAEKLVGRGKVEFGADINGRVGLEAHDIIVLYDLSGNVVSTTDNLSIDSATRVDSGFFVQGDTPLGAQFSAAGGLRVDYVSNTNTGGYFGDQSVSNGAVAGFGALTAGPFSNVTLVAQVSRGFRDPTLSDRFFRGPSGRGFITGNPDLEPETSLQYDIGARYAAGRLRLASYFYHYRITNLVERYPTGEPDSFAFRNRGRARVRGFEVEAQADLGHGYSLEFGAQVSRGVALDDDAALDDISPDLFSVSMRKAFAADVLVFMRLANYADDDRPGPSEIVAPGHTNLDAGVSWFLSRRVELRGSVRNLLNQEYYASPDPRFVLAPGINGAITFVLKD